MSIRLLPKTVPAEKSWLWGLGKIAAVLLVGGFLVSMAIAPTMSLRRAASTMSSKAASVENPAGRADYSKDYGGEVFFDGEVAALDVDEFSASTFADPEPTADPKSALSSLRDSLSKGVAVNDAAVNGTTLPSPYYLQDDVQYFPSQPKSSKQIQRQTLNDGRESSKPDASPSQQGDYSFYMPLDRGRSSFGNGSSEPAKPTSGQQQQSDTKVEFVPELGQIVIRGSKVDVDRAKAIIDDLEKQSVLAEPSEESTPQIANNEKRRPLASGNLSNQMDMPMDMGMDMGMGNGGFSGGMSGQPSNGARRFGDASRADMDFGMRPQATEPSNDDKILYSKRPERRVAGSQSESKEQLEPMFGTPDSPGQHFDFSGLTYDRSNANKDGVARDEPNSTGFREKDQKRQTGTAEAEASISQLEDQAPAEPQSAEMGDANDPLEMAQSGFDPKASNSPEIRHRFLAEKQSQLSDELRSKEIVLKQVEELAKRAEDPAVAARVVGDMLGTGDPFSHSQNMVDVDAELGSIEVNKQLIPLIIERYDHAAQFGESHPSVVELDSKLNATRNEVREKLQARIREFSAARKRSDSKPKAEANEAVVSMIDSAKAEVELLKSQLADLKLQAANELAK
ncbi:MAG: hypothetical protein WBD20_00285, partial [Pirellulaceae bacterium]